MGTCRARREKAGSGVARQDKPLAAPAAGAKGSRSVNMLADPVLSISGGGRMSLPGLFAAMTRGRTRGFPALRPHQRPAWHMFLVQLGALAAWRDPGGGLPEDAEAWAAALRRLTPEHADDAPGRLSVYDWRKPAFLQPPVLGNTGKLKWSEVGTPDALDMLITARNHDLKSAIAREAEAEDWIYALVSLQTCEGYSGGGNYGIARMNGGSSSRLRRAPTVSKLFADGGYQGPKLRTALKELGVSELIEIVEKPKDAKEFTVLYRRWVVERSFSWMGRCRRLAKDFERTVDSSLAWSKLAACRFLMRRVAR